MNMRVLIVDDEPLARRAMRQLLAAYRDVEIVGECADAIDAAEVLGRRAVDVVFLDIRMPQISGLALARKLGSTPLVVFVTAHAELGAAAYETGAAEYIVKPVTTERLRMAIGRVRERLAEMQAAKLLRQQGTRQFTNRVTDLPADAPATEYLTRLVVRVGNRDVVLPVEEVELIAADDVHVAVHRGGRRYEMRVTLDRLARELNPEQFIRVHRSYVIPLSGIVAVHHRRGGEATIELRNGASIPVSRRRRGVLARLESTAAKG